MPKKKREHTKTHKCPECGAVWGVRPGEDVECPKCDWARDRKARMAKKIREERFQVTYDDTTKEVDAPTPDIAMQKAGQGNPEFKRSKNVNVQKAQMGGPATKPAGAATRPVQPGVQGMQGLTDTYESTKFRYDYTIGLPNGFTDFMKKTKGRTKGLVVEQREGRVYMTVESPEAMDKLMGKLNKAARSRTVETRDKARTLIRGILGSMK